MTSSASRRYHFLILSCLIVIALVWWMPTTYRLHRLAFATAIITASVVFLIRIWPHFFLRQAAVIVLAVATLLFVLPGRDHDREALRTRYVSALESYRETPYVWGGENARGIDCSGLPRAAMIDALRSEGLSTFNPSLLRASLRLWWLDASAHALASGYGQMLPRTSKETSLKKVIGTGQTGIRPGDIAISSDGVHAMVAGGERIWLHACPLERKVVTLPKTSSWLAAPAHIYRWAWLAE